MLTKAQRNLLQALADGKTIGRAQDGVSYSIRNTRIGEESVSFAAKTTDPLIAASLVKVVHGDVHLDRWQYRVLELTAAGRAALSEER